MLNSIHKVFPKPGPTDATDDEPIALKKLLQGNDW